jgi:hypothetical protein
MQVGLWLIHCDWCGVRWQVGEIPFARFWRRKRVLMTGRLFFKTEHHRIFRLRFRRDLLDRKFPRKWIGRGGSIILQPSSPDPTSPFLLVGGGGGVYRILFTFHHCPLLWHSLLGEYELLRLYLPLPYTDCGLEDNTMCDRLLTVSLPSFYRVFKEE